LGLDMKSLHGSYERRFRGKRQKMQSHSLPGSHGPKSSDVGAPVESSEQYWRFDQHGIPYRLTKGEYRFETFFAWAFWLFVAVVMLTKLIGVL
jgi:hypothetical protein